ncbi:MAG: hypothetical protein HY273_04860 [Gammaproteobacteria bacterium]|nr:hypothetical protein [Gammaproteobacteria bacterium]
MKAIDTRFDKYQHSEDDCVAETVQQIEAAGSFPPIPIAVVTGGKKIPLVPEACFAIHRQCQNELTALSPYSVQIIANNSGHFPQITEPEIVIRAIQEIIFNVNKWRSRLGSGAYIFRRAVCSAPHLLSISIDSKHDSALVH